MLNKSNKLLHHRIIVKRTLSMCVYDIKHIDIRNHMRVSMIFMYLVNALLDVLYSYVLVTDD